ncbi:hypothetical protein [Streptomyces virginiae]|uniref:hypothetical protein n=1 Tax=Streptomyces virginiae TaxID=1961 RepID=UPI0036312E52
MLVGRDADDPTTSIRLALAPFQDALSAQVADQQLTVVGATSSRTASSFTVIGPLSEQVIVTITGVPDGRTGVAGAVP